MYLGALNFSVCLCRILKSALSGETTKEDDKAPNSPNFKPAQRPTAQKMATPLINQLLIPARFLMTFGHLLAVVLASEFCDHGVTVTLHSDSALQQMDQTVPHGKDSPIHAAFIISYVCLFIDFIGLLAGYSILVSPLNWYQVVMHFVGGLLMSGFVVWSWHIYFDLMIWKIVGLTSTTTAILEISLAIKVMQNLRDYKACILLGITGNRNLLEGNEDSETSLLALPIKKRWC